MHHIMEQGYHGSLISSTGVLYTEWHDIIHIGSPMSGECHLSFVFLGLFDLIISWESVHEGEEPIGSNIIDQGINMWQWEIILGAGSVQIPIVDAHAYFPIFLRHENNVGGPIWVGYHIKETGFQLLFYFLLDLQNDLKFHPLKGLPHWRAFWLNWNSVHDNLSIQPWHILVGPSKFLFELFE